MSLGDLRVTARARRSRRHLCLRGTSLFASGKCSRLSACRSSPRVWDLFALAAVDGGKWQPITVSVCVSRKARSAPEEMDRRDSNDLSPFTFVMEPIRLPLMSLLFHLGPLTFFLPEIVCSASRVATLNLSHPPTPRVCLCPTLCRGSRRGGGAHRQSQPVRRVLRQRVRSQLPVQEQRGRDLH